MKRRIVCIAAALALCLCLLPGIALAVDETPMLTIGSAPLMAGKEYVADDETGAVTEKTPATPEGTPYLACSADGTTLTVHGAFVTNTPLTVIFDLTVTGEAGSSLTVTTANDQAIKLAEGALTLDGDVDFTGNCSDSNVIASLGDAGTFETAETYSGAIVLRSDNRSTQAVFNATLDVQNSDSIAITGTINAMNGSVVLKSAGDITCKSEGPGMPAIAGRTEISAGGAVTISSSGGAPVHISGTTGGLTVTKAESVTISGKSSSDSDLSSGIPFFPVTVTFGDCGSVRVTDSGNGAFLGENCTLTSAEPVSVTKDGEAKLYIDGTLWADAGEPGEFQLDLEHITTPTCWTAGNGRIFYEPAAADADSPAKLTLDSAEYAGQISAYEAKGLDVTVKGVNKAGIITNLSGDLTLTGSGNLTAESIITQRGGTITNDITGALNTVLVQYGDDKNTYEVYGEAELPGSFLTLTQGEGSGRDNVSLTIQPGATLTIPKGKEIEIRKFDCLKNEGAIVNNGTVSLAGAAAVGADAESVKALHLTGSGMVQVVAVNGDKTTYTNSGVQRLTPVNVLPLYMFDTAQTGYWESNGYKWTDVVKDSSGKVTGGTLTLAKGFEANEVILPDGEVKIVTEGDSLIGTLTTKELDNNRTPNIKLTFSGPGKLTLEKRLGLDGNHSDIIISEGAHVIAKQGLTSGDSGGHSSVTVDGTLEAKYYNDGTHDFPAVYTGKVAVGNKGVLEVSGAEGVSLNGKSDELESQTAMFTVTGNGRFTADCSDYNIRVGTNTGSFHANATAAGAIVLGAEYIPDDCEVRFSEGKTEINLIRISANEVYTGPLTIHKNHTWETGWDNDGDTHWHPCEFAGCTEKKPGSEAAHYYAHGSTACRDCNYPRPAGAPDSDGGGSSGSSSSGGGGSSYTVTVEKASHGEVSSNRRAASAGDTVTLTVTADSGYTLNTLTVTDSRGNEIGLTEKAGKYTFTMPSRAVTVRAAFVSSACTGGADCPSRGYSDLNTNMWYHEAVDYVLRNGLMSGYGGGLFGPDDTLSRAQFAQIIYNREGRPAVTGESAFTDVSPDAWYAPAVNWAAAKGIVSGYGNGLFGPDDKITREQLAAMLWRYAGCPETGRDAEFGDMAEVSDYALEAVDWARANDIIRGRDGNLFDPKGPATRVEAAAMLMRYLSK